MNKLIILSVIASMTFGPAFAQETAALNPPTTVKSLGDVVLNCEAVAARLASARGQCFGTTQLYLTGLGSDLNDGIIADLVDQLARLAQLDDECGIFDEEIANTIRYAASFSEDDEVRLRILEIAQTIEDCDATNTAALPAPISP